MKRSEINQLIRSAEACFKAHGWTLPPKPNWDVTDFGLGDPKKFALVLVNLTEEAEYTEKLLYARKGMTTPTHTHKKKKEDIISRWGTLRVRVWLGLPKAAGRNAFQVKINGEMRALDSGDCVDLKAGERITLVPGIYHEFFPQTEECIMGEVSTANDDLHDNFFENPNVGRYPHVVEDEPPLLKLLSDK